MINVIVRVKNITHPKNILDENLAHVFVIIVSIFVFFFYNINFTRHKSQVKKLK